MHDANDKDADTCTMSVDGQSDDDGNHVSERGGDRRQECDRSNLSDASEHEHDDDEDIEDTGTVDASIAMDIEDESDDGERTMERGDPNGEQPLAMKTMMAMMLTMTMTMMKLMRFLYARRATASHHGVLYGDKRRKKSTLTFLRSRA
jgi:hypothetical protein